MVKRKWTNVALVFNNDVTARNLARPWATIFLLFTFSGCQNESESVKADMQAKNKMTAKPQITVVTQSQSANSPNGESLKDIAIEIPSPATGATELFDGLTLRGWKVTNFGGEGDCYVEKGEIVVEAGYPMSGITYTGDNLPNTNYEISLDAMKTDGDDFFCGLTFPVDDSFCSVIVGGWGGVVCGLSCIDGEDASTNATRKVRSFKSNQWYRMKLRVLPNRILVWIDDQQIVNQELQGHKVSLRNETLPSRPLGLCNFQTYSRFRNIKLTRLVNDDHGQKSSNHAAKPR